MQHRHHVFYVIWNLLIIGLKDGSQEPVTVIEAISAAGLAHDPTILFKGKIFYTDYLKYQIKGASYGMTECGWTNDDEGMKWLHTFVQKTKLYFPIFILNLINV